VFGNSRSTASRSGVDAARCIARTMPEKYFAVIGQMFRNWMSGASLPIRFMVSFVSRYPWHERESVEPVSRIRLYRNKLSADENFAHKVLKVNATRPSSFNAERIKAQSRSKSSTSGSNNCC